MGLRLDPAPIGSPLSVDRRAMTLIVAASTPWSRWFTRLTSFVTNDAVARFAGIVPTVDGTDFTIVHNLGTRDVFVSLRDVETGELQDGVTFASVSDNTVEVSLLLPVPAKSLSALVVG